MAIVAKYPDSTKVSLEQRLHARARERWPQIASLHIRHRGIFSYIDATLTDATSLQLCRLRYVGSAHQWQFAIYRASHDDYEKSVLPTGYPAGTPQEALDCACGLYLSHPGAYYFGVAKVERDQVEDYATRKGMAVREVERWLGPVLNYTPVAEKGAA